MHTHNEARDLPRDKMRRGGPLAVSLLLTPYESTSVSNSIPRVGSKPLKNRSDQITQTRTSGKVLVMQVSLRLGAREKQTRRGCCW